MGPSITKRVFYCGVIVEGSENGRRLPDGVWVFEVICVSDSISIEIQDLVLSLGNPLPSEESSIDQSTGQAEYMNDIVCDCFDT